MGKRTKLKIDTRGPLQKLADTEAANDAKAPTVNPFAEQHGRYEARGMYDGARKMMRNLAVSPVVAWFAEGGPGFDDPQMRALEFLERLWMKVETQGQLTANYGGSIGGGGIEGRNYFEALSELDYWQEYFGNVYWDIFQNVVRFHEPAGVAGSKLALNRPQATASAKAVVGLILSKIAEKKHM